MKWISVTHSKEMSFHAHFVLEKKFQNITLLFALINNRVFFIRKQNLKVYKPDNSYFCSVLFLILLWRKDGSYLFHKSFILACVELLIIEKKKKKIIINLEIDIEE